jgi:hypothetical protein
MPDAVRAVGAAATATERDMIAHQKWHLYLCFYENIFLGIDGFSLHTHLGQTTLKEVIHV